MVLTAVLAFSVFLPMEDPWEHRYATVEELSDGTVALVNGEVMEDLCVFLFDQQGELIASRKDLSVPGRALESGGWIVPSSDGGFFMVSFSEPRATGIDSDIAVFRLNGDYSTRWVDVIGEGTDDVFTCFGASGSPGGRVAVLGGEGYAGLNSFLRVYEDDGTVAWEQSWSEDEGYLPVAVGQVAGGNLVLHSHVLPDRAFLQMYDTSGAMEWETALPLNVIHGPAAFCDTEMGYGVFFGTGDVNSRSGVTLLVRPDGQVLERLSMAHMTDLSGAALDGNLQVALAGSIAAGDYYRGIFQSRDFQGGTPWFRTIQGEGESGFSALCPLESGGFLLAGYFIPEDPGATAGGLMIRTLPDGSVEGTPEPGVIPLPE